MGTSSRSDGCSRAHVGAGTDGLRDMRHRAALSSDRGSAVLEMVILAPVLLLFVVLVIAGGRVTIAQQAVQSAASESARAASIARNPTEAAGKATAAGGASLTNQDVRCATADVTVDTTGFTVTVGTPATVAATVTCVVDLSDLAVPGVPGSHTLTSTMTSPLDTYRSREG